MKDIRHKIVFALSAVSVWIDHLLRAFWPLLSALFLLIAAALFHVTAVLSPVLLQILTLSVVCLGVAWGIRRFIPPTRADIENRLTQSNRLPFNPYRALKDRPAHGFSPDQHALWLRNEALSRRMKSRLWPALPKPALKNHDPKGLRFLCFGLLCLAFLSAGETRGTLLKTAFIPERPDFLKPRITELWLTPPAYTSLAPTYLSESPEKPLSVPEGTSVTARVNKGWLTPRLVTGNISTAFKKAQNGYTVEAPLNLKDETLKITNGILPLLRADIQVYKDTPPIISLVEGPTETENKAVKFRFVGRDDFGLQYIEFVMRPDPMVAHRLGNPKPWIRRYETGNENFIDQTRSLTLYDHPWSGLPVDITLRAVDTKGQVSTSAGHSFILPEKVFTHPLARQLAEIRRELFRTADLDSYHLFANRIGKLRDRTETYNGATDTYLGMTLAMYRLDYMRETRGKNIKSTRELLWDLALRIEGGSSRVAAERLQNTLAEVAQALKNPGLSEEEFAKLRSKLEQAVTEYMQSLMNELAAQMQAQGMEGLPPGFENMVHNQIDTGDFLRDLQETLKSGSREDITKALQNMQDMVESLKNMQFQPMSQEMKKALQELAKLKELIRTQEALLDETQTLAPEIIRKSFNYSEDSLPEDGGESIFNGETLPPQPSESLDYFEQPKQAEKQPSPTVETERQAKKQGEIAENLGIIQQELETATGKNADFMTRAGAAMGKSKTALDRDLPATSIPHQERAIRELKQGMQQTMKQIASGLGKIISFGLPSGGMKKNGGKNGTDPFGRPLAGEGDMRGDVDITGEEKRRRIQEIRDKILDNADEVQENPLGEGYYDRLLERF